MSKYPILQSGFLGIRDKGLQQSNQQEPSFRDAVIFKVVKNPLAKYRFSSEVNDIFKTWSASPELIKDFDFRERIIKAAFDSFGTNNFFEWLMLQSGKSTTSDLHATFITETLDYLLTNTERKVHCVSWLRLIEMDDRHNSVRLDLKKYFKQDSSANYLDNQKLPVNMHEVIKLWLSKESGYVDLLFVLMVIFGERSGRSAITKETT